ncbi:MAG: calcium/sodium antiporter [Gammaproteobacteria bacterium]|jgi:cation:H+ antiporter|nr:calcium/sodium antiporter [Gammaproteobacteria bacterium]MBT4492319.1 calcium/sodium antiporter [Gammaproteobacteria bacterium]MBT7370960.1 calcium/sodium antiporter [Gammaproteobacteria bacterium]
MTEALLALVLGIVLLAVSADRFVAGAAVTANVLGIPPLLVGMLVIGFGSSMPEFVVSVIAATEGNAGLALGNAFGSNISNVALILGITALITPITVKSTVLTTELPILIFITMICTVLLSVDGVLGRGDGWTLIVIFIFVMGWSIYIGMGTKQDELGTEVEHALKDRLSLPMAVTFMIGGLIFLVISSRLLVWGGVSVAHLLGISDVIIGLTIIAIGTSLPELASSIAAVRHNEHDLAIGNVIGSNMFNTTIVIGTAGAISPTTIEPAMITRDIPIMIGFTFLLFVSCYSLGSSTPRITRGEAVALLICYLGYNTLLFSQMFR